ncbi:hypothetical protein BB934_31980 (plasmid) [Microvirga ossetica]|uniref:Uncharacterized protein n=1 Tax=Microvirga ossetica TaxID=1882682 RepID=A0A1B2ES93_9HYPH|nr:hypothetical protein BB934_31980 [Microvirga ossetica]
MDRLDGDPCAQKRPGDQKTGCESVPEKPDCHCRPFRSRIGLLTMSRIEQDFIQAMRSVDAADQTDRAKLPIE